MLTLQMTRPRAASERFVARIAPDLRRRLHVIHSPLIRIVFLPDPVSSGDARGVIFTSANGVAAAQAAGLRPALPAYCVGAATAGAARDAGWTVEMICDTADALVAALIDRRPDAPLLHLRGRHARGDVADRLTAAGVETRAQEVYDQQLIDPSEAARVALDGADPVIAPLFSPRTARHFADTCAGRAPLFLAAISRAAAEPLENMVYRGLIVARRPDGAAMVTAVETLAAQATSG
ncbi:uroporphyrinogen-III synthase [Aquicoccus sp. SU-CL01552]|uniref:uroporphyrinogen-III synthase n=1 Tax=Aquicoccus sp. SU-CL01552 TaxID=3127656 RepID=UPI0031034B9E